MTTANRPRTVGYLRVSTASQDTEKFKNEILAFSNKNDFGKVEFIEETASGVKNWRERQLGQLIDSMSTGDRLIVPEMSRLGRSILEVLEIIKIAQDKGILVNAIKGGWELNGTIESKIMATMLALISEIEHDFIVSRTKEALAAKKAAGVKLGRPKGKPGHSKLDQYRPEIEALLANGSTKVFIAQRYKTTPANLNNWLKMNQIKNPKEMPINGE